MAADFDAIVAGAGPAGSLSAYRLAAAGLRVLILDAAQFPRDKACGGGVQQRAFRHIPFDWRSAVHQELNEFALSFGLLPQFTRGSANPLVLSVLRTEFDALLLEAARSAGAEALLGTRVSGVEFAEGEPVRVRTSRGDFTSRYLIGADGANSVVGARINPRPSFFWQVALYCEVPRELLLEDRTPDGRMAVDWGSLPSGYGWVFPKTSTVNVGVGAPVSIGKSLRPYLDNFVGSQRMLRPEARSRIRFKGHQLPTLTRATKFGHANVLLAGDAAGLIDPLTGEGISNACHSAGLAAQAILESESNGHPAIHCYERALRREIVPDILHSRQLLSLSVAFPRRVLRIFQHDEVVWAVFCRTLRGDASFLELLETITANLGILAGPVRKIACLWEALRIQRYQGKLAQLS